MKIVLFSYLKFTLLFIVLCCMFYPAFLICVNYLLPEKTFSGKLFIDDRYIYKEIVIKTDDPGYFMPRPSAAGHNPIQSGASNKGPYDPDYLDEINLRQYEYRKINNYHKGLVPVDAVTASGSGLDAYISVKNALIQSGRIAELTGLKRSEITALIDAEKERGFLSGEIVNINRLNAKLYQVNKSK